MRPRHSVVAESRAGDFFQPVCASGEMAASGRVLLSETDRKGDILAGWALLGSGPINGIHATVGL